MEKQDTKKEYSQSKSAAEEDNEYNIDHIMDEDEKSEPPAKKPASLPSNPKAKPTFNKAADEKIVLV